MVWDKLPAPVVMKPELEEKKLVVDDVKIESSVSTDVPDDLVSVRRVVFVCKVSKRQPGCPSFSSGRSASARPPEMIPRLQLVGIPEHCL